MDFTLGSLVTWASQASGYTRVRTGKVVARLAPGETPGPYLKRFFRHDVTQVSCASKPRKHLSYLVSVTREEHPNFKPRIYWPWVSRLRPAQSKVKACQHQHAI